MAKIIDLGNGYGRIEGYPSQYASLTFPLTRFQILRLYIMGILSQDETKATLLEMGYEWSAINWAIAVANVTTEQWKEAINGMGTI